MIQIMFIWALINAIVSVLNVINLRRLKKEWKKIEESEPGDKDWDMTVDLLG